MELTSEQEAAKFLDSLSLGGSTEVAPVPNNLDKDDIFDANSDLISLVDKELKSRLKYTDAVSTKELVSIKAEAFRQNQLLKGESTTLDTSKLIPVNFNIQVINNNG